MTTSSASMSVLVGKEFVCIKVSGRGNFTFGPDFKTLLTELHRKGYRRFIIDLSECVLMDSTFLGVLAGFGLKLSGATGNQAPGVELHNPSERIVDLIENLGAPHLFQITRGALVLPDALSASAPAPLHPTAEQITRTCLEAHQTLMSVSPENAARFKDVTQFLAEDLKNLQKPA